MGEPGDRFGCLRPIDERLGLWRRWPSIPGAGKKGGCGGPPVPCRPLVLDNLDLGGCPEWSGFRGSEKIVAFREAAIAVAVPGQSRGRRLSKASGLKMPREHDWGRGATACVPSVLHSSPGSQQRLSFSLSWSPSTVALESLNRRGMVEIPSQVVLLAMGSPYEVFQHSCSSDGYLPTRPLSR